MNIHICYSYNHQHQAMGGGRDPEAMGLQVGAEEEALTSSAPGDCSTCSLPKYQTFRYIYQRPLHDYTQFVSLFDIMLIRYICKHYWLIFTP